MTEVENSTSSQIRVRRSQIYCKDHPEWGTFGVYEDRGDYFEIHGDAGSRILTKSEADKFWAVKNSHERGEKLNNEVQSMDIKEIAALVKNAVEEAIAAKNGEDRMDAMEATLAKHGDALNEINEKLSPKKEEAENADGEAKKEEEEKAATLENAKPSQEMVKAFSTALNVDFGAKTPSFATLAALAGLSETDPALRIAAVNTKFAEMQKNAPKENQAAAAQNATAGEVF